ADPESGFSLDLKYMVHKIHMGELLPTSRDADPANDFFIVGFQQSVHDYTDILLPPSATTYMDGGNDPGLVRDCAMCHQGADAERAYTAPSRSACSACHDDIDVATGQGHPLVAQANDAACKVCHVEVDETSPQYVPRAHDLNYDTDT